MADGIDFSFDSANGEGGGSSSASGSVAGNDGSNGPTGGPNNAAGTAPETLVRKRRGRKPLPRDAAGNIIRAEGEAEIKASSGAPGKAKENLDLGKAKAFVVNDRKAVLNNVQGLHMLLAIATKQPVFALNEQESAGMTKALCDVLDYHRINITDVTGPWGLYAALAFTAFSVYKPRVDAIRFAKMKSAEPAARPATAMDAEFSVPSGGMDFSGDLDPSKMQ